MAGLTTMIHPTACVDKNASLGHACQIWHYTHIAQDAHVGDGCMVGQGCYIAPGVRVGNGVRIQNQVSLFTGVTIEDDVFIGPNCTLTNVNVPRAFRPTPKGYGRIVLRRGCSLGANATLLPKVEVGYFALVGAGAVVTRHVPDFAVVIGNPARLYGYISHAGHPLPDGENPQQIRVCPELGLRYRLEHHRMICLDLSPHDPLPEPLQRTTLHPIRGSASPLQA